jgi:RimJ/RimL family protein N-acetyltransferase
LRQQRLPHWRSLIPLEFQFVPIDKALLHRTNLTNYAAIADWIKGWHTTEYFLQHGFGFCLLHGDTIASWCIADCALGDKCEIGVKTDWRYRRRGLATTVVAGTVDYCLSTGFRHIGWHCLDSNAGSLAVAQQVGFGRVHTYCAYSSTLPTENATDLTPAEYTEWAEHYEHTGTTDCWYRFCAAEAWALAGQPERALANLRGLLECGWRGQPECLEDNWRFASIQDLSEFGAFIAKLRHIQ